MSFKNDHLSVSRLRLYEQCARAFYFRYVNKGPTLPFGDAPLFGVVLHEALEVFFRWILAEEFSGPFPVEKLIEAYKAAWQNLGIVGVATFQEGLDMLRSYAASHPPIDHFKIIDVEKEFTIRVGDFLVNGFIDRVERGEQDGEIQIVDYKTNRQLYTKDDLATDLQFAVYGLAARELYPWATKVSYVFAMLRFDTRQASVQTVQKIDDAAGYVGALGRRIESDTEWKPRLNENCGYCDHRARCDAYQAVLAGKHPAPSVSDPANIDAVVREREGVAKLAKLLYARKDELDKILKRKVAEEGAFTTGDGIHVRLIPAFDTVYPRVSTVQAFAATGLPVAEIERRILVVDPKAVATLRDEVVASASMEQAYIVKATVNALAVKTPATPRIDVRAEKTAKTVASLARHGKKETS